MSALVIVLIVLGVLIVLVFIGGLVAARRRTRTQMGSYEQHIAEADHALEQARAGDKGWDRPVMEQAARQALSEARPDRSFEELALVLVDDPPGVTEDRAHFMAAGSEGEVRVVLVRGDAGWYAERVE